MTDKHVFISHVSTEAEIASGLKQRLDRDFEGLRVFVSSDRDGIQAGERWLEELEGALKGADLQLVLCSTGSVDRPWVNFEAGAAWLRGIPVIPVCHSGYSGEQLPAPFSALQWVECTRHGMQRLYDRIAKELDVVTPAVDFERLAAEMRRLDDAPPSNAPAIDCIEEPRVLCAASAQYNEPGLGFNFDVDVLESKFGSERLTIERALTSARLTEHLTGGTYDIVHLVTAVDPVSGDMYFSPIDFGTYRPATDVVDKLPAAGLANLLAASGTRLVVLATCHAKLLAHEVAHVATMAASKAIISGRQAAAWEEIFYGLLARGTPAYRAFEITRSQIDVPMELVPHRDVAFSVRAPGPAA